MDTTSRVKNEQCVKKFQGFFSTKGATHLRHEVLQTLKCLLEFLFVDFNFDKHTMHTQQPITVKVMRLEFCQNLKSVVWPPTLDSRMRFPI